MNILCQTYTKVPSSDEEEEGNVSDSDSEEEEEDANDSDEAQESEDTGKVFTNGFN